MPRMKKTATIESSLSGMTKAEVPGCVFTHRHQSADWFLGGRCQLGVFLTMIFQWYTKQKHTARVGSRALSRLGAHTIPGWWLEPLKAHPVKTHTQIASQMYQAHLQHPAVLIHITLKGVISYLKIPLDLSSLTIKTTLKSEIKSHNQSIIIR